MDCLIYEWTNGYLFSTLAPASVWQHRWQ